MKAAVVLVAAGTIVFDVTAARTCVEALRDHACETFEPALRYRESYCVDPFTGMLPDGATCEANEMCAGGYCHPDYLDLAKPGTCQTRVPPGGACSVIAGMACESPYLCQGDGTCGLGRPAGQSCGGDSDCIDHWCEGDRFCRRACDGR